MTPRPGRLRLAYSGGRRRAGRALNCTNPYGLTPAELTAEIRRLTARGWPLWEIRQRLCPCNDPETKSDPAR
jgi:hypothetical protein